MVSCHAVALSQCRNFFLAHPQLTVHPAYDTAGSVLDVANLADPQFAAVASRRSAERYKLDILVADIEDRPDNQTRFLALATAPQALPTGTPARTMLLLTARDVPGALLNALAPLARHGVNVRRIETRPAGEPAEAGVREVAGRAHAVRLLGTYPRWSAGRRGSIGWKSGSLPGVE